VILSLQEHCLFFCLSVLPTTNTLLRGAQAGFVYGAALGVLDGRKTPMRRERGRVWYGNWFLLLVAACSQLGTMTSSMTTTATMVCTERGTVFRLDLR
jgi:hypothetical protein